MKTCIKCGSTTNPFPKSKNTCKPCIKIWKRQYQIDNAETLAAQRKQYRAKNKEIISAKGKQFTIDNKEMLAKRKKKYYSKNSAEILSRQREWYKDNAEKVKAKQIEYNKKHRVEQKEYAKQQRIDNRHPDAKNGSDYNVFYIWKVTNTKWENKTIYKAGITSERLGNKRIRQVANDFGFKYEIIKYEVCDNALELERQWHNKNVIMPILEKKCGYSEFRVI